VGPVCGPLASLRKVSFVGRPRGKDSLTALVAANLFGCVQCAIPSFASKLIRAYSNHGRSSQSCRWVLVAWGQLHPTLQYMVEPAHTVWPDGRHFPSGTCFHTIHISSRSKNQGMRYRNELSTGIPNTLPECHLHARPRDDSVFTCKLESWLPWSLTEATLRRPSYTKVIKRSSCSHQTWAH
jgi:hypothetical protein